MAPLADVTDPAWRALVAKLGKPSVTFAEFVSADGLYHTRKVAKLSDEENPLIRDLRFTEIERPVVAQFFSAKSEMISYAAHVAAELGFDGVDINMGCPDRAIEKQGAGAALIKTPALAKEIVIAAKSAGLPVSVKTRVGYNAETFDEWLPALISAEPAAITLHLRTRKEMSKVPARWDLMRRAVTIRDALGSKIPLVGNGDVRNLEDAREKAKRYGADGVMLGRAVFGNPWMFAGRKREETPPAERAAALVTLARSFEELRPKKSFHILKKHIKAFVVGFDGAAELRAKLMEAENAHELEELVRKLAPSA